MCRIVVAETPGFEKKLETIDFRIREVLAYVLRNSATPVNYGRRRRKANTSISAGTIDHDFSTNRDFRPGGRISLLHGNPLRRLP